MFPSFVFLKISTLTVTFPYLLDGWIYRLGMRYRCFLQIRYPPRMETLLGDSTHTVYIAVGGI